MIIVSWDVGIIHLAYCVLEYTIDENGKKTVDIIDWDEINLIDDRVKLDCCGKMKVKGGNSNGVCGKNATYFLNTGDGKTYGFCKMHLLQHTEYWSKKNTEMLFKNCDGDTCTYLKKNGNICGKTARKSYENNNDVQKLCSAHHKQFYLKKIKEYSPKPIKNMIVKKYPIEKLQFSLANKLNELAPHFAKLNVEEIVIENQPSYKNPKMKSISCTLFDYFLIKGFIDNYEGMNIKLVRFMSPSNKLKINNDNTLEIFKANKDKKKKYKLTKALGIQYTKKLLENDPIQLEYLDLYKKKDDVCDAYLQGRYYLEFIRNDDKNSMTGLKNSVKTNDNNAGENDDNNSKKHIKHTKKHVKKSNKKSGSKYKDTGIILL